jgi:hypothetical protein
LPDEERVDAMKSAREDYFRCAAAFEPILDKARSRRNRDYCQQHAGAITASIPKEPERH